MEWSQLELLIVLVQGHIQFISLDNNWQPSGPGGGLLGPVVEQQAFAPSPSRKNHNRHLLSLQVKSG